MRAQFYSIIAVMITIPIIFFISQYIVLQTRGSNVYERIVSDQIQQTEKSVEKDFERALITSGKRALISASDHVVLNGTPLDDSILRIKELMENGTLYGEGKIMMENNTLNDWVDRILNVPTNFNISLNYSDLDINAYSSFYINLSANVDIRVSDELGIAKMERISKSNVSTTIEGLEDPIFPLNTNGLVTRIVRQYPFSYYSKKFEGTDFSNNCDNNPASVTFDYLNDEPSKILVVKNISIVSNPSGYAGIVDEESESVEIDCYVSGVSNAVEMINASIQETNFNEIYLDNDTVWHLPIKLGIDQGLYYPGDGPNLLERLENKRGSSINNSGRGLETFVNIQELESFGIPIKEERTCVAYLYFSDEILGGVYRVKGLYNWFRIDYAHAEKYNLEELLE
jgi:hypothetical protein